MCGIPKDGTGAQGVACFFCELASSLSLEQSQNCASFTSLKAFLSREIKASFNGDEPKKKDAFSMTKEAF